MTFTRVQASRRKRGCERNSDRTPLRWNGRQAEITINSVRMERRIVLCWQEGGKADGQRVVLEKVVSSLFTWLWINKNMGSGKHLLSIMSGRGTPMHLSRLGVSQTRVQKDTHAHARTCTIHTALISCLESEARPSAPFLDGLSIPSLPSPYISDP